MMAMRALLLLGLLPAASALTIGTTLQRCRFASPAMMAKKAAVKKDMEVVLTAAVDGLGKPGDLVSVKPAYAQNFLISKGLGKLATPAMLKEISEQVAADKASKAAGLAEAEEKKKTIEAVFGAQGAFIKKKVGPDGAMFGSVTSAEVADMIAERAGVSVDKKGIEAPKLKAVGSEVISVDLHKEVTVSIKVSVVPAAL